MSSRSIEDLHPALAAKYAEFDRAMKAAKIDYIVTCTYRSKAEQNALYASGRSKPGPWLTNAKGGQSKHNSVDKNGKPASEAFDIVIMVKGKPDWDASTAAWRTAGKIGVKLGLEWGGSWTHKDYPHFQLKG